MAATKKESSPSFVAVAWLESVHAFNKAREMVGPVGALLSLYLVIMQGWGTHEQKVEFVSKVLLIHGLPVTPRGWMLLVSLVLGLFALLVQHRYFIQKTRLLETRVEQLVAVNEKLKKSAHPVPIERKLLFDDEEKP